MSDIIVFTNRSEIQHLLQTDVNDISSLIECNKLHLYTFAYITKVEASNLIELYNELNYKEKNYDDTFEVDQMLNLNSLAIIIEKLKDKELIDYNLYCQLISFLNNYDTNKSCLEIAKQDFNIYVKEYKNEQLISSKAIAEKLGIKYPKFVLSINRNIEQLKKIRGR
jgi:hypothetical protein